MGSNTAYRTFQPSIDDLGTHLSQVTFVVVDLETTGNGKDSTITEIGAVKVRGGEVLGEFQTLVNPHTHIPAIIAVLTGITNEMVADAPPLERVLPSFLAFAENTVLVAHNAGFDIGYLKRACIQFGYDWPGNPVVDTLALARSCLLRDEVRNCKLATLAAHFHATTEPNHRALSDARATVDVLHGLLERVGNLGVSTLEDLVEFTHKVSPQRRAKRVWAKSLPEAPGIYLFRADNPATGSSEVLYVGKSVNIRRRVAQYFTASESRGRMEEMIRVATSVEAVVCATPLEAEIRELRTIAAHQPRYNRKSRRQDKVLWVKLTRERYPRLTTVREIKDDGCVYWGPFANRQQSEASMLALYDAFPIRRCSQSIGPRSHPTVCALAEIGKCVAPCQSPDEAAYAQLVDELASALRIDVRPVVSVVGSRLQLLAKQERFEEAVTVRERLTSYLATTLRWHRLQALVGCPQIVAAKRSSGPGSEPGAWDIHIIRYGKLAAAATARAGVEARAVADELTRTAETVPAPTPGMPAGSIEEAELLARWLESPGVRLLDIDGTWGLPLNVAIDPQDVARRAMGAPASDAELNEARLPDLSPALAGTDFIHNTELLAQLELSPGDLRQPVLSA